jgi:iron(III) transport system ATP-binding protein
MGNIQLKGIEKSFGTKKVLENINLDVKNGEMLALLGPSGCGKTTLLKVIAGLLKPDKGDIVFDYKSVVDIPTGAREVVMVFQDYVLFPHLNVAENIGFGLRMAGIPKKERSKKVSQLLELVQMKGFENRYPRQLSGGQKQRVAFARALAVEPKVLLLDEPFSNLDYRLREEMREFTCHLQRKMGVTTILVTHDREEAMMTADRIALMLDGQIKQCDTPVNLYFKPNSPEVASFFGEANYIQGRVIEGIFQCSLGRFQAPLGLEGKVSAMIRPEQIEISDNGEWPIKGRIIERRFAGEKRYYRVKVGDYILKVTSPSWKTLKHDSVGVVIDFNEISYFKDVKGGS